MKRVVVIVIGLGIVVAVGLVTTGIGGWRALTTVIDPEAIEPVLIRVDEGESVARLATALEDQQRIPSAFWFRVAARVRGVTLSPGLYHLTPGTTPLALLDVLSSGNVAEVKVTLPEGWRTEEIADRLVAAEVTDRVSLIAATQATASYTALVERLGLTGNESLEGFLFPDTYRFALDGTGEDVVQTMVSNFLNRTESLSLTYDTVKLASIVEREARLSEDRPLIAGVYANRLAIGMGLDADPTVQFSKATRDNVSCLMTVAEPAETCGLVNWWPVITVSDYRGVKSPTNTYLNAGLPPEPIANPGLASLEAAAAPAEHDYLYFVTDADGKAHFAETFAEHQANKVQYLR